VDGDAAALGEGLKDGLNVHGNLDCKTSDGVDLSTVVSRLLVDGGLHIDGVAPGGVDLLDGSADVQKEGAVAVVGALAGIGEVPAEVDVGGAEGVLELPAEGTVGHVLEALKIHPVDALGDGTGPVILVVDDRLALLDDLPNLLADLDQLVDVDVLEVLGRKRVGKRSALKIGGDGVKALDGAEERAGQRDGGDAKLIISDSQSDARNGEQCNNSAHCSVRVLKKNEQKKKKLGKAIARTGK